MYLGIDLGTSGVKVILVDTNGKLISEAGQTYPLLMPQSLWTEQDPKQWLSATVKAVKTCVKGYGKEVRALSFSGQMHGSVILDDQDKVLRPAILWNDQRTVEEVEYLNNQIGKEKLLSETGNIALTGFTAPKILWIKNNEPEVFKKIDKIMLPKDYIAYCFSNVFASDVSDMSGSLLFNVEKKIYSKFMLNIIGISEKQLPKVYESQSVIGNLTDEYAKILGLSNNVKVIIGGGDQACGAIGTGAVTNNNINVALGTSGVVFVASETYHVDNVSYLHSFAHANGKYHLMGVTLNAAGSFQWWRDTFFENKKFQTLFDGLMETPVDDTIYYLPYLNGERSPINDSDAKGAFVGFTISHESKHFTRALIEGVTYSLKQCYDVVLGLGIENKQIRVTGGGAKNPDWCQMISDVFNVPVETISVSEGPALGAAILAMVGDNVYNSVEDACEALIKPNKVFKPNDNNVIIYSKKYKKYLSLYQSLKSFFGDMN